MRLFNLLLASSLFFTTGCVQYHYSPNFVHTPYISKKGDGQCSAALSFSPVSVNGNFHASYSPLKYSVVMFNYFNTRADYRESRIFGGTSYNKAYRGRLFEGALGGYIPFEFGTIALYSGWAEGRMRNDYGANRIADFRLQRFFVQPAFTYKNDWFRLGMGLRFVRLHFPSASIDYRIETADVEQIRQIERHTPLVFPELGGNVGVHFKPLTISANLVIMSTKVAAQYGFDTYNIGLGLSLDFQELYKNRDKTADVEH